MSKIVCANNTTLNTYMTHTPLNVGDAGYKNVYLLPDEGENSFLLCLTDADGIQDLTSCFLHLTSPRRVLQFACVLVLLRAEGNYTFTSSYFFGGNIKFYNGKVSPSKPFKSL